MNILSFQVRPRIEFAGIPRSPNSFNCSEDPDFIAEFDRMLPTREDPGPTRTHFAVDFYRIGLKQKRGRAALGHLWLANDRSVDSDRSGFIAERPGQLQSWRIRRSEAVNKIKSERYNRVNRKGPSRDPAKAGKNCEGCDDPNRVARPAVSHQSADDRGKGDPEKWLTRPGSLRFHWFRGEDALLNHRYNAAITRPRRESL